MTSAIAETFRKSGAARLAPSVVYALAAAILLYLIWQVHRVPLAQVSYNRDIWHHLSVYRELIAAPFDARNPHVDTGDPSRSYSPWTMAIALLTKALGQNELMAISLSAVLSMLTILAGIFLFAREYWRSQWSPVLLLLIMLTTWIHQENHTGYHTLSTFLFSASYPWAVVLGAGFVSWFLALRALSSEHFPWWIAFALFLLAYAMFITHQMQGLFATGATGAFVILARETSWKRRLVLVLALLLGLASTSTWFYFNPISYVLNPEIIHGHSAIDQARDKFSDGTRILRTFGFAFLGLIGFRNWAERKFCWEFALPFLVMAAVFFITLANNSWLLIRMPPFVILYLQLGLCNLLCQKMPGTVIPWAKASIVLVLSTSLLTNGLGAWRYQERARSYISTGKVAYPFKTWGRNILQSARQVVASVPAGSVAIAHDDTAFPIEATSLSVVAIPRLFAEVPDMLARQRDNERFFDMGTSQEERCQTIRRYHVSLIVWHKDWLAAETANQIGRFGPMNREGDMVFIPAPARGFIGCPNLPEPR